MQLILKKKSVATSDTTLNVDEGSTYTENYNETLDSAVIRISHLTSPLNIEPFDKVVLHDEEDRLSDKYMCVDSYTETFESLDPRIYGYEIHLFSETKELENVVLPNLSITRNELQVRTVKHYIEQYVNLYCPKIRINGSFVNKYTLSNRINNFTEECPEMQWNCPTLREVLNDLMMVQDKIVILKNNAIDYIDLTETKLAIDTSKVNYVQTSQSSEDYVSELKMDMLNVMQTSLDGVKQTVNRTEYQTFKATDDGYVVTEENAILKTDYPILEIKHLWMVFQKNISSGASSGMYWRKTTMYKVDLCNLLLVDDTYKNLVYERQEYNTLPQRRYNPTNFNEINQNIAVYFNREGNTIEGWYNLSRQQWTFSNKISTLKILKNIIPAYCYDVDGVKATNIINDSLSTNSYFSTFFIIEYKTTADAVFKAGKDIAPSHERVVTDNQTNAYVDAYNQGFMEYQKANRLGNKQMFLNARFDSDYNGIIKIGDYYQSYIVYQTEYQIYENHIEVNAVATPSYILRDYFTGVKARIRSWKLADVTQSFTRHELVKYYLEFSTRRKNEYGTFDDGLARYFLSPLYANNITPLKYGFIKAEGSLEYPTPNNYYVVEMLGRIIGNSVVFTLGVNDNWSISKKVANITTDNIAVSQSGSEAPGENSVFCVKSSGYTSNYGGVPLEDATYANELGELTTLNYYLTYDRHSGHFPDTITKSGGTIIGSNNQKSWMVEQCNLPVVEYGDFASYMKYHNTKLMYKDNREMPKISTQFEFCVDNRGRIAFTRKFLELQQCIRELTSEESVIEHRTGQIQFTENHWGQRGGTISINITVAATTGVFDGEIPYYYGDFDVKDLSLAGVSLTNVSITDNTSTHHSNTINYDKDYSEINPITHQEEYFGRFYGRVYSDTSRNVTVTISYVVVGEENVIQYQSSSFQDNSLIGQRVINMTQTGLSNAFTYRFNFNSNTGTINLYAETESSTNPGAITVNIGFDLILQSGTYVANNLKVYKGYAGLFDWRNPHLGNAWLIGDQSKVLVGVGSQSCSITIDDSDYSIYAYYIVDASSNEILLAMRQTNLIYLNILLSRDYNVYDDGRNVVGTI